MIFYEQTGLFKEILPVIHEILSGKYAKNAMTMMKKSEKNTVLRYAALLNSVNEEKARQTLKSLKLDNYTVDTASKLVAYQKVSIDENEPSVREALHKYGKDLLKLMLVHEHAIIETKEEITGITMPARRKHLLIIEHMYKDILERGDCISIKDLDITGNDLMEYGLKGPQIGKTLNELLQIVIENPKLNEKATLIGMIEHVN